MAFDVPVPRSYQAIFGEITDTFRARYGISRIKIGGPFLRIFEAAAQSDLRCTQDIFNLLDLADFNRLQGFALDYKAAEDGVLRLGARPASGSLTFRDPRFVRLGARVYSGSAPPVAGTTAILVTDATLFPATGQIYIGRGTVNAEGPLTYTSKTAIGQYWSLSLASPTTKFHNSNEDVVLAQGGDRTIPIGTTCTTARDGRTAPVTFATTALAAILDGETEISSVPAVSRLPGRAGNVPSQSIVTVSSQPFPQVVCLNPLPLVNGRDAETDDELRERLRQARASKSRGTRTAILFSVQGLSSAEDQRSVLSASLVRPVGEPATLYIDDGTGYEEQTRGVPYEILMDFASGGEEIYTLSGRRPIAKAHLVSGLSAPFALQDGHQLAVLGGGRLQTHVFDDIDFTSIGSATAQEVVSSINSDPDIEFSARTANNGTRVALFSRRETNEDLQVVTPVGSDANTALGFSTAATYTLRLYRNDALQYKDGLPATLIGAAQTSWAPMSGNVEVRISVDRTAATTYTITDADFVAAGTPYTSLSHTNSVQSWADVLNYRIPGITAADAGGFLVLASNLGANSRAALALESTANPNVVQSGMFTPSLGLAAAGVASDYTLDRMTGEIKLNRRLAPGDSLTVGSDNTRAAVTSASHSGAAVTLAANGRLYVCVDAAAQIVNTNLSAAMSLTATALTSDRTEFVASSSTAFGSTTSQLAVGDYVVVWDPAFACQGVFRVTSLPSAAPFDRFVVEKPQTATETAVIPLLGGVKFFRLTTGAIQTIRLTAGVNRPLTAVAAEINEQLIAATASVWQNTRIRLRSNNLDASASEIAVLTADLQGQSLGLPLGVTARGSVPHRGFVTSTSEVGTPVFGAEDYVQTPNIDLGPLAIEYSNIPVADLPDIWGLSMYSLRRQQSTGVEFFGNTVDQHRPVAAYNTSTRRLSLRHVDTPVVATSVVRAGSTVTVTMPANHRFVVGDLVWVGPTGASDPYFTDGIQVVASVPTQSTWTYTQAGTAATAGSPYGVNLWHGALASASTISGDLLVPCRPLSIGAHDSLSVTLNGDSVNQSYVIPMQRRIKPASATYTANTPIDVVDSDNGNTPLSSTFGTQDSNFFEDFWVYQHARTVSHKVLSSGQYHRAILWRAKRFGPEGNRYWIRYGNPTSPDAQLSHSIDLETDPVATTEPAVYVTIKLPSGPARTGLKMFNTTAWNWVVTPDTGPPAYKSVVISYSAPTIAAGSLSRSSGTVTASTGASNHGYTTGQIVWLTSSDANFPAGPKYVVVTSPTAFTYAEAGANVASASPTSVSSSPTAPDFTNVAVGDVVNIKVTGTNGVQPTGVWRVYAKTATSFTIRVPAANSVVSSTTPAAMGDATAFEFYPIDTANSLASDIVAYATSDMEDLVSATLIGLGDQAITASTADEYYANTAANTGYLASAVAAWQMSQGLSWVAESDLVSTPNKITLKGTANANPDLQTNADVTNEEWLLVPVLAGGVSRWLNSPAVTGAYATTDFDVVDKQAVQISSRILGSQGGVQITAGLANAVRTGILGGAERYLGVYGRLLIDSALSDGVHGDQYVVLANGLPTPKSIDLSAASLQVYANGDVVVSGGPTLWTLATFGSPGDKVGVHRVGRFAIFCLPSGIVQNTGAAIPDPRGYWWQCTAASNQVNRNVRRIVGFQDTTDHRFIWVEAPDAVNEVMTLGSTTDIKVWTPDSVMPGDTLEIGFDFGSSSLNQGAFVVEAHGGTAATVNVNHVFAPSGPTALGVNHTLVRFTEPRFRLVERIRTVVANPASASSTYLLLAPSGTASQLSKLNPTLGANLEVLDKLELSTGPAMGADGYSVSTGLIGEVARTLYGDPNAPTLYPGVVAVGSTVYIAGPNSKRVRISLQLRIRSGTPVQSTLDRVRAAVAAEINRVPLGTAIDLSRVVSAARRVQGIASVVVLSPTYSASQDNIPVQANEKPFVFDAENDILLTPIGV